MDSSVFSGQETWSKEERKELLFRKILSLKDVSGECFSANQRLLRELLTLEPEHEGGWTVWAAWLVGEKRYEEAAEVLRKLASRRHDEDGLRWTWGMVLAAAERYEEALKVVEPLERKVVGWPRKCFLGNLYGMCGEVEKGRKCFRETAQPFQKPILRWKHLQFFSPFWENAKAIDRGWQRLVRDLDAALEERPVYHWLEFARLGFYPSFELAHQGKCCREVKEKFAQLIRGTFSSRRKPFRRRGNREKIRVGFFCVPENEGGFFRSTQAIWEGLNPHRFEVMLFLSRERVPRWYTVPASVNLVTYEGDFAATVEKIRAAACDVLFYRKAVADLWSSCLPLLRLAPVQCTSWGTHGTSGIAEMDYYLTWDAAEIPQAQEHYTEKLYRMKTPPKLERQEMAVVSASVAATREELGLPRQGAIYFCPHRWSKYHPDFDFYLRDILRQDTRGHLLLLGGKSTWWGEKFRKRIRNVLGEKEFRRVLFLPRLSPWLYHRYLSAATVLLDSCVYAGEWTCHDAFSHGVPCVTQVGNLLVQRYSTAHYQAMGIPHPPVATCRSEYVRQALRLGTDVPYRAEISRAIRETYPARRGNIGVIQEYEEFFENACAEACYG
ncbi:MAG: hypothetical protein Q4D62_12040 [Planctomycetia bacterium]|nr:hypothetical protein [Planctomycetia bacterium]